MHASYRRYIIAAVGIVTALGAAGGLFVGLNPEEVPIRSSGTVEAVTSNALAGGRECEPARLKAATGPEGMDARDRCAKAAREQQDHRNEFILARANADAAKASAVYAFDQARVAAIGGVFGFVTLFAALGAAIFAERAAHYTKVAATETKRMNEAVVKCHIEIKEATIRFDEKTLNPIVYIKLLNSSDFPANNFRWLYSVTYRAKNSEERKGPINRPQLNTHGMTLGPREMKEKMPLVITFPIVGDEISALQGPNHPGLLVFVTISMLWENVFGHPVTDEQYLFGQGFGFDTESVYARGRAIHLTPTYTPAEPIQIE